MIAREQDRRRFGIAICAGLFALAVLPYLRVVEHGFVSYDDDLYVFDNARVLQGLGWDGVRWAFTTDAAGNWHPLTWLSHMLDVTLFGTNAAGHHAVSVALHAINTVLLWLAMRSLTGAWLRSALVAALFAVHPLRVESVAWVAERKDVLSGLFWMLSLLAYGWYARRPGIGRLAVVSLALAGGLAAKPMVVTLPLVFLLLDAWPLRRLRTARDLPRLLLEKLPCFVLVAASSATTLRVQDAAGVVQSLEHLGLPVRLGNAAITYVAYVWKTLWPFPLAPFYPHPATLPSFSPARFFLSAIAATIVLAACTWLAVRGFRRRPYVAVGWLWYLVTLLPVIGLVQVGMQGMADRYTYLPSIGLYWMASWTLAGIATRSAIPRAVSAAAAAAVLLAWSALSWVQAGRWKDDLTLFEHATRVTRDNYVMQSHLGNAYAREGDLQRAVAELETAIRIKPDYARAHNNLGVVLQLQGELERAVRSYQRAVELDPRYARAMVNAGNAHQLRGDPGSAIAAYRGAIEAAPTDVDAHEQLGVLLAHTGALPEARDHLGRAVQLDPWRATAHQNLGFVLRELGDLPGAARHFEAAIRIAPENAEAHNSLGSVLERTGDLDGAKARFEAAIRLRPDYADAINNLGIVLARQGDLQQAIGHFERAVALDPRNAAARDNLRRATGRDS